MPYRKTTLISWTLFAVNAFSLQTNGIPLIDELTMIAIINTIVWGSIAHYVYHVLQDFKRILKINIFTIPNKEITTVPDQKQAQSSVRKT